MPRKRIKPNNTWAGSKLTIPESPPLSAEQRARLKRIAALPIAAAALPAVVALAERFLALALRPLPSSAQVQARSMSRW